MWPSICHLYTQLIFQTSNLSSPVTCFSGAACSTAAVLNIEAECFAMMYSVFYRYK